jgi:hypothetical protein
MKQDLRRYPQAKYNFDEMTLLGSHQDLIQQLRYYSKILIKELFKIKR